MEIIQIAYSQHLRSKSGWEGKVCCIGKVPLPIDRVIVEFGMKRVLNLRDGTADRNFSAAA